MDNALFSTTSSEPSSSSEDAGDRDGGSFVESREKSSIDAGSEGEVMISGDCCSAWTPVGVGLVVSELLLLDLSNDRNVGRLGVDFD